MAEENVSAPRSTGSTEMRRGRRFAIYDFSQFWRSDRWVDSSRPAWALACPGEQRAAILKAFDESSLSAMAFCRQHQLSYSTFTAWLQRRKKGQVVGKADTDPGPPPAFAEVILDEGKPELKLAPPLRVVLRSGVSFEIGSAEQLPLAVGLIQSLAGSRSC